MKIVANPPEELESFFDSLSDAGKEAAPINYRFVVTLPASANEPACIAASAFYRTTGFYCLKFHKPISKILSTDES